MRHVRRDDEKSGEGPSGCICHLSRDSYAYRRHSRNMLESCLIKTNVKVIQGIFQSEKILCAL